MPKRFHSLSFMNKSIAISRSRGRTWMALVYLLGVASIHTAARATENGGFGPYAVGAQTLGAGVLPPAGKTTTYQYTLYYSAGTFVDGDGKSMIPGFDLTVAAEGTMTRHTWDLSYAGLSFGSALIQQAIHVQLDAAGNSDEDGGFTLLNIQPIAISRTIGSWHLLTASHLLFPLGHYDATALANSANNYFAFAQEFSATWTPSARWMVDVSTNLSFNRRNKKTEYKSGDLFGLTWAANYRPFANAPNVQVGLNGLYLRQIEDDMKRSSPVGDGFRIRKVSAGPQIGYWISPHIAVVLKWQKEWEVRNAPKGDVIWLQAAIPM